MSHDEPSFFSELRRHFTAEPWCVDDLEIVDNQLILKGWALPIQGDPTRGAIYVNDRQAEETTFGGARPDIAHCYGYAPNSVASGYRSASPLAESETILKAEYR